MVSRTLFWVFLWEMGGKGGSRGKGRSHSKTFLFSQSCFFMPRQQLEMPRMFKLGLVEWSTVQCALYYGHTDTRHRAILCLMIAQLFEIYFSFRSAGRFWAFLRQQSGYVSTSGVRPAGKGRHRKKTELQVNKSSPIIQQFTFNSKVHHLFLSLHIIQKFTHNSIVYFLIQKFTHNS